VEERESMKMFHILLYRSKHLQTEGGQAKSKFRPVSRAAHGLAEAEFYLFIHLL
jgi:hypothetical protein